MRSLSIQALTQSRERAIEWILSHQRKDGFFEADFGFRHGPTQAWSTALVANLLPNTKERAAAIQFLRSCGTDHPSYGTAWGYNALTPPDADTTFEVWRALLAEGFVPNRDLVHRLRHPRGGFATYTEADASLIYPGTSVKGWAAPHLEITANMLRLARARAGIDSGWQELVGRIADDLVMQVRRTGWRAYWYHSDVVAANMVVQALGVYRADLPPLPLSTRTGELSWEVRNNPHIIASALELALVADPRSYKEVIAFLAKRLIESQQPDGSWRPTLVLSVPYPDEVDPRWVQHINADYKLPTVSVVRVASALGQLNDYLAGQPATTVH